MPTDAALLAEVPFFELLSEEERQELATSADVVSFKEGDQVFRFGDPGESLYVIRTGEVEVYFKDDTGRRIVLEVPGPGDFFGEISLLDSGPRTASVVASKATEVLKVDRRDVAMLLASHPGAAMSVLAATGRRLRKTSDLLRHTASRNVNEEVEDTRRAVTKAADWISESSGSLPFLFVHLGWFATWLILNTSLGPRFGVPATITGFDPPPFGLLTLIVSLEAIILSVFVLLSQNRQAAKDRIRSDVEYEVNLKAELEIAHLHEKVDHMNSDVLERLSALERQRR
jgi:CRP/FNR family transcriptional regulator, cyclic AMP receptor protein